MLRSTLILIGATSALTMTELSIAQSQSNQGHPQTKPWGVEHNHQTEPYRARMRDNSGNRVIINGRVVDLGDSASPGNYDSSVSQRGTGTLPGRGTLGRGPTLSAVAIGNSIDLRGISNSTLVLNQYNYGQQIASVPGQRAATGTENDTENDNTE